MGARDLVGDRRQGLDSGSTPHDVDQLHPISVPKTLASVKIGPTCSPTYRNFSSATLSIGKPADALGSQPMKHESL